MSKKGNYIVVVLFYFQKICYNIPYDTRVPRSLHTRACSYVCKRIWNPPKYEHKSGTQSRDMRIFCRIARVRSRSQSVGIIKHHELRPGLREYEVRAIRRYHKTSRIETGIARVRSRSQSVGIIKHHELRPGLREYEVRAIRRYHSLLLTSLHDYVI